MRYRKAKPEKCCAGSSRIERAGDRAQRDVAAAAKSRAQSTENAESGKIRFADQERA
jgi:hypothetical protein